MSKQVVIIGGGIGGGTVAAALKGISGLEVVVVNPNPFQVYKYATLRAIAQGGDVGSNTVIPLNAVADRLVVGKATEIVPSEKSVKVDVKGETETVKYDYLICATGSWNSAMKMTEPETKGLDEIKSYFNESSQIVKNAKSIVVIGGGSVGVELAGELRDVNSTAKMTIIQRGEKLIPSNPPLQKKFYNNVNKTLAKRSIDIKFKTTVEGLDATSFQGNSYLSGQRSLQLSDGTTLEADLVFWSVGNTINTGIYPSEWKNEKGQLKVNGSCNVNGVQDIFAIGDINDVPENKMGYFTTLQAGVVAKNIKLLAAGKPAKHEHKPQGSMMVLPIGASHGVADMKIFVMGSWVTSLLKGKGLFIGQGWSALKAGKPKGWSQRSSDAVVLS